MRFKSADLTPALLKKRTAVALGKEPADLVVKAVSIFDVFQGEFSLGDVAISSDTIVGISESYQGKSEIDGKGYFLLPGFIDSHLHIESSLMTPARFQQVVLPRGTTTAIWDPHEIANVLGEAGVRWASDSAARLWMDVFVLLPSCVPATALETSGGTLTASDLMRLKNLPKVLGLAEFMNVPGVLQADSECAEKLSSFSDGVRDGHAPLVSGRDLNAYLCGGIQCCHESTGVEEAREKLRKGMHVLIREGSCTKDADTLLPLLNAYTSATMGLCTDDRNPQDILGEGHLDFIIRRALEKEIPAETIFRAASFGAARAFGLLDRGVIAPGYLADLVLVKQKQAGAWSRGFDIASVIKKGRVVDSNELVTFSQTDRPHCRPKVTRKNIQLGDFSSDKFRISAGVHGSSPVRCRVMVIQPRTVLTLEEIHELPTDRRGYVQGDVKKGIQKVAVCERHHATGNVGVGFALGFGLSEGAIAASIGHDSHNITVIGVSDSPMAAAVHAVEAMDGGIAIVDSSGSLLASLCLPIGGLMTDESPENIASSLLILKQAAASIGCQLEEPFQQLSFLALPVIPHLKLTDLGLVDVSQCKFVDVVLT